MNRPSRPVPNAPRTAGPTPGRRPAGRAADALRQAGRRLRELLRQDVWDIELGALPGARRVLFRMVRVVQLVVRGFKHDECVLHASSLTFITLLAIVPVLALGLSMARVFGADDHARTQLKALAREWLTDQPPALPFLTSAREVAPAAPEPPAATEAPDAPPPEAPDATAPPTPTPPAADGALSIERIEELIDTGFDRVAELNFRALGGLGLAFLLWAVIGGLGQVEGAFNRVWGVTDQRTLSRKFTDYLSVLIVVPFLITVASTLPVVDQLGDFLSGDDAPMALPLLGQRLLRLGGAVVLLTLSFAFLLRFLPNTRVRPGPCLVGGLVTAVLALGWLRLCTAFQVGVARNSAFFGSFATIPVLLSWVYVSWAILLFGAEISFAVQNADTYRMEQGAGQASMRTRLIVAVDLLATAARRLVAGDGLLSIGDYVRERRVSVRLVNDVVRDLAQRKLLVEIAEEPGVFAVRRDVSGLTVAEVVRGLLDSGSQPRALGVRGPVEGLLREPFDAGLAELLPQRLTEVTPGSAAPAAKEPA